MRLVKNRDYISYGSSPSANNSLLQCVYHLNETEAVHWEMWDGVNKLGTYEWRPGSGGNATGRLEKVVEQSRDNESLELTKLRNDLRDRYSCGVSLIYGFTENADQEVFIIDVKGTSTFLGYIQKCIYTNSYQTATVFQEQTLEAKMFSPKLNQYYEEISSKGWFKVIHPSGYVPKSYNYVSFKIHEEAPDDIAFKLMKGINKSNGEYSSFGEDIIFTSTWHELGCPDVREDNKQVHYCPEDSATCRGGRKNMTIATMTCKNGYQAEGNVSIVTMRCNGTSLTWEPEQGQTTTFEDLVCVAVHYGAENTVITDAPGGGASNGYPNLVLLSAFLLDVIVRLFPFSHP